MISAIFWFSKSLSLKKVNLMAKQWNDEKIRTLLGRLIKLTDRGDLSWEEESPSRGVSGDRFSASTPTATFYVGSADGDGAPPYIFEVRGEDGSLIEKVRHPLPRSPFSFPDIADMGGRIGLENSMHELYTTARRSALDIDSILDSIIQDLDDE